MKLKRTKIICTIGPTTETFSSIKKLHQAGMNVARLNMSHSDHKNAKKIIDRIKKLNKTIENIQGIAYYWATLSAEKKGILQKHKEGEEWLGGPFVSILSLQYYIDYLENNDQLDVNKFLHLLFVYLKYHK